LIHGNSVLSQLGGYEWGETGISCDSKEENLLQMYIKVWKRGGDMFEEL